MSSARPTILCVSSYFKGNRFLQRAKREGCRVYLLTLQTLHDAPWARDHLDDLFYMPSFGKLSEVIYGLAWLMRQQPIDLIVALDDYDVELAAALREHFRLPGSNSSTARFFRDKLAMRLRARQAGLPVPPFVPLFSVEPIRDFLARVPPPWLIKPRSEASSIGIQKLQTPEEVWRRFEALGDYASYHLLEQFVPSDVYHVDSLVVGGQVVFSEVSRYHRPLLEVYQGGGVFASRTAPRDWPEVGMLRDLAARLLSAFGLERGCAHTEFLRSRADGTFSFLETGARVGGACLAEMIEAATGINLWEEWAGVEILGEGYRLPAVRQEYAGAVVSLARTERPDTSAFSDPEVVYRLDQKHHIGLVVRSERAERVEQLLDDYVQRIARDHQAALPPANQPSA
jgi:hypothetical protein